MSRASRVVLPVLDLEQNDKPIVKRVVKGCKELSVQRITADSSGASSCSFSWQPPSQNTILDRRIEIEVPVRLSNTLGGGANFTLTPTVSAGTPDVVQNIQFPRISTRVSVNAVATGAAPLPASVLAGATAKLSNNLACRQFPVASIIETIDMTINGTHFTASLNQYLHALMKYTSNDYREKTFGSNGYHHPDTNDYGLGIGEQDNPLNLFGESSRNGETPRGASFYKDFKRGANQNGDAEAGMIGVIREPLFLSPLMMEFGHGMTNINDVSVSINWSTDLNRLFSFIPTASLGIVARQAANALVDTSLSVDFNEKPNLIVRYYTPQDDISIPNEIILPYKQPKIVLQSAVTIGNGGTHTFDGSNIRLNQIPDSCYIFAKQQRSTANINSADVYCDITGVRLSWKNRSGVLSGHRQPQLLQMAIDNGADVDNAESSVSGYVLKMVFGKDIPLDDNESGGTRGDYNWQISVDVTNHLTSRSWEFYQVFVYNGQVVISPNECRVSTGVLDLKDNVEAEEMGENYNEHNGSGGSYVAGSMVGGGEAGGSLLGSKSSHLASKLMKSGKLAMSMAGDMKPCVDGAKSAYDKYKTRS